jgi:MFS family permease
MSQQVGTWRELLATGRLAQFITLCLGVWLHAADSFLAATALPQAVHEIGGVAVINWAVGLYQLGAIVSGAAVGVLARKFGMQRVLIVAAVSYALGCVASALAPEMTTMLAGRLVQGMGGGIMIALTYVATQRMFPEHLWVRLLTIVATIWGVSALCGPLIGGAFAAIGLWRGAFWAFAAQAGLLVVAALVWLRNLPEGPRNVPGWPWPALLVLSIATLAIATAGIVAPASALALAACGLALLYAAAKLDARSPIRLMPVEILQPLHPVGSGLLMVLALAIGFVVFPAYGPLLLQLQFNTNPLIAGYIVASLSVAWTLGTLATSGASPGAETHVIRLGAVMVTLAGIGLTIFIGSGPLFAIVLCVLMQGAGAGACWPFVVKRIVAAAPKAERDLAASAASSIQRIGYAIGASASGIAANAAGLALHPTPATASWAGTVVFACFIPILLIGCLGAWGLTSRR